MNKSKTGRRAYSSPGRAGAADETRARILACAKDLFSQRGIDAVTMAEIAEKSGVAGSTVYAVFKSKEGILRGLMAQSLFGGQFQSAQQILAGIGDPIEAIALTAHVSRAIYESERSDLGLLRNVSGFSPALRQIEEEFEQTRHRMQEGRLRRLFAAGRENRRISFDEARRILWMYTSRDVYRMLVIEGGWTPDRYQEWLSRTLVEALVEGDASGCSPTRPHAAVTEPGGKPASRYSACRASSAPTAGLAQRCSVCSSACEGSATRQRVRRSCCMRASSAAAISASASARCARPVRGRPW